MGHTIDLGSIISNLSKGNPCSVMAMMEIAKYSGLIDPQDVLGDSGLGMFLIFDEQKILGTEIYILWNDKCNQDVRKLKLLFRMQQLGYTTMERIKEMSLDQRREKNISNEEWEEWEENIAMELPTFMTSENWEKIKILYD